MKKFSKDFDAFTNSWWPYLITFFIGLISAIRFYVGGVQYTKTNRIDGKIVIITGGSTGIGFETAKNLASRGGRIILAIRNAEKGKRALEKIKQNYPDAEVIVRLLDMGEISSIKNFVLQLFKDYEKIDILINNAAVIYQPYRKTVDGYEATLMINYLGPFLLTHLLLPLLNKSENGRIINVSAMAHYNGKLHMDDLNMEKQYNEKDAYSQSKLALTIFTKYLASLLKKTKIVCYAVSPGLVRNTGHLQNLPLQRSFWSKLTIWPWIWLFLKNPKQGCQSIVYLAVDPSLGNVSGYYFSDCEVKDPSALVQDVHLAKALYEKTCNIVDIDGMEIIKHLEGKKLETLNESRENDYNF
ncbi:hypothetical protein ABEB36_015431 [Hypothenemus hampei]|uniref:Uncharacterized protein n=1 Tax=Hypothenemus hampei TaxID=57062 RepID=A0ABD1E058_HYPHA